MVSWTYINWIKDLPWNAEDNKIKSLPLAKAKKIFDKNHFGLDKVKERILEYIAVLQHRGNIPGQILLLNGPPGVGKTSLVKSIAEALNRPYAKVSLGGVHDEAEIRGHRRTYIGSMPGKILHAVKETGSSKAVILLDEIDKVGTSSGRELSSALLEVLDPEQNKNFVDHYLALPFDLSQIIFVATANHLSDISAPLLDRMESLTLPGYTEQEKIMIATGHLMPAICKELKLTKRQFSLSRSFLSIVINNYTREAGVRQLKRELQTIGRKIVKSIVSKSKNKPVIRPKIDNIMSLLGPPHFLDEPKDKVLQPGVSIGLAYTQFGGDILYIESRKMPSSGQKGKLSLTGSLGKVMQESAQTCLWYLVSNADTLGLDRKEIEASDVHLHFPDGATPKDGPSAGLAILCTLVSLFKDKSLPNQIAMTGEITLRGQVLPVGGIKEKLLAAHRYNKRKVIIPYTNFLDLEELPQDALNELEIYPIKKMEEVLYVSGLLKGNKIKPVRYKKKTFRLNKTKNTNFSIHSFME
jgi:ATP-dependent Lon protease